MSGTDKQLYIQTQNVTKEFPGTIALQDVDFDINLGEVHAIVGENGAGKSTLMKILSGALKPTSGDIFVCGERVEFNTPADARDRNITMIYQELTNLPKLSVAENIFVGRLPVKKAFGFVDYKKLYHDTKNIFQEFDINIPIDKRLSLLSVAEKQFVEIIKSIAVDDAKIVIMDEPTSSLSRNETEKLFAIIKSLKERNIGIIYISHRMDEVMEIADRVSVLRDGRKVTTLAKEEIDLNTIVSLMLGRDIVKSEREEVERKEIVFEVQNLNIKNKVQDFSLTLYKGEILGIAGLMGSGKDELVKSLFGLWPTDSKKVVYLGEEIKLEDPRKGLKHRIAYMPEERKTQSIFASLSVQKNISAIWLFEKNGSLVINSKNEDQLCKNYMEQLSIKASSGSQLINNLSGGNQQKTILARILAVNPKVIILNDPTRGIDVGSKEEIYTIIRKLAKEGTSIILVSSELDELCYLSHRVMVLSRGRICGEFTDEEVTMNNVLPCAVRAGFDEQ